MNTKSAERNGSKKSAIESDFPQHVEILMKGNPDE
jgi:hypothetical protein